MQATDLNLLQSDVVDIQKRNINDDLVISVLPIIYDLDGTMRQGTVGEEVEKLGVEREVERGLHQVAEVVRVNVGAVVMLDFFVVVTPTSVLDALGVIACCSRESVHDAGMLTVRLKTGLFSVLEREGRVHLYSQQRFEHGGKP